MLTINDDFVRRNRFGIGTVRLIKCHASTNNEWSIPNDHSVTWRRLNGGTSPSIASQMTTHRNIWNRKASGSDVHPTGDPDRDGCVLETPHNICEKQSITRPANCPRGPIPKRTRIRPKLARELFSTSPSLASSSTSTSSVISSSSSSTSSSLRLVPISSSDSDESSREYPSISRKRKRCLSRVSRRRVAHSSHSYSDDSYSDNIPTDIEPLNYMDDPADDDIVILSPPDEPTSDTEPLKCSTTDDEVILPDELTAEPTHYSVYTQTRPVQGILMQTWHWLFGE